MTAVLLPTISLPTASSETCSATESSLCGLFTRLSGDQELSRSLNATVGPPVRVALILLGALIVRRIALRLIRHAVNRITANDHTRGGDDPGGADPVRTSRRAARARTLASVLENIVTVSLLVVTPTMILQELGFPVAPLLASLSIVGVAVGFGSQALVKDVITGIFMIAEDQYGVGDSVDVGEAKGVVEAVGLRTTRLRDPDGTVWYVRNGQILRVGNRSQGWSRALLNVPVAYTEDLERVREVLLKAAAELRKDPKLATLIVADPEVWGVESMDATAAVIRLAVRTQPGQEQVVARALRMRVKQALDAVGVQPAPLPTGI
jgi:small-conductance mechanosensitive channel